ncbi:MAG: glycosyltransferase family 2 protein [bacterium]
MSVTVVVCNYNGKQHLPHCLGALRELKGDIAEVLVVDNASTDGSCALIEESYPEVRLIAREDNPGPPRARNLGLEEARTRWVLAIDNDAILPPDTLLELLAAAEQTGAVLVQPRSVFADDTSRVHYDGGWFHFAGLISLRNFYVPLREAEGQGRVEVDCAISMCLLMNRERVLEFGGYDEGYFILFEDLDLSYRLRMAGERIVSVENVVVEHRAGTPGVSFREGAHYPSSRVFLHSRNRWQLLFKCWSARALILASPGLVVYEAASLAFAIRHGHLGPWLRGKWAFLERLPALFRARHAVQRTRCLRDRELLVAGPLTVTPDAAAGGTGQRALAWLNSLLTCWWKLVSRFA